MSGDNGENKKKSIPKFEEKWLYAYLHVALKVIEGLNRKISKLQGGIISDGDAQICIKKEALDSFPENNKPFFVWDNSKEHWAMMNPKHEEPKKTKLELPNRGLILP